ncbi:MAG: hypothetical protein FWE76_05795, partial [Symbiobacteriaceae bacterium]|nr:hypothetical protein [Symbiobacteriaceae bacterium]
MQKRFLSILLIVSLVISLAVPLVAADPGDSNPQLNEEQLQAYNEILAMGELSGLYGFVEADISLDNEDMVPVIVMFKHNPAEVEQALQQAAGYQPVQPAFFPFNPAPSLQELADNDKTIFYDSLDNIFTKPAPQTPFVPAIAPLTSPDYYITLDYDTAINGLAMTLPANKVAELLSIDSVAAVFYDETVYVDGWVDDDDLVGEAFAVASNKVSSMAMEIQLAHA